MGRYQEVWTELRCGNELDLGSSTIRSRIASLDAQVRHYSSAIIFRKGSIWPNLGFDGPPSNLTASAERLEVMSQAWATEGSSFYGDADIGSRVVEGIQILVDNRYGAAPFQGNWWEWKIGTPKKILSAVVLLGEQVPEDLIKQVQDVISLHIDNDVRDKYSGANFVDIALALALQAALDEDDERVRDQYAAAHRVLEPVSTGDGFYPDGSFIQHESVPYTNSYGAVLLSGLMLLSRLASVSLEQRLSATSFDAAYFQTSMTHLIEVAYFPFLHDGIALDCVAGRAVARGKSRDGVDQSDGTRGLDILATVTGFALGLDEIRQRRLLSTVRGHLLRSRGRQVISEEGLSIAALQLLQRVNNDSRIPIADEPVGVDIFGSMDRSVVRQSGWTMSLSFNSKRTSYYETGHSENVRGWHSSSGLMCWWGDGEADGSQYSSDYWPTVDPFGLPGTTVSLKHLPDGAGGTWGRTRPGHSWAGGSSYLQYAALGMTVSGLNSSLRGRKSWFTFEAGVVCIGSAIRCSDSSPVNTNVDTRRVDRGAVVRVGREATTTLLTLGDSRAFRDPTWAHIEGHAGYQFLMPGSLSARVTTRQGSWSDINVEHGAEDELSELYSELKMEHGVDPRDGGYAYTVLPGVTLAELKKLNDECHVELIHISSDAHVVEIDQVLYANVFEGVDLPDKGLRISGRCSLVWIERDGRCVISVSDPTQLQETICIEVRESVELIESHPRIRLEECVRGTVMQFDVSGLRGSSFTGEIIMMQASSRRES